VNKYDLSDFLHQKNVSVTPLFCVLDTWLQFREAGQKSGSGKRLYSQIDVVTVI
jgi:hypothetical protein